MTKYLSGGMRLRERQLLTVEEPTPHSSATTAVPPRASMMSSTDVSIQSEYSQPVNLSTIHDGEIFTACELSPNNAMTFSQSELAYRLELSRKALGLSPTCMADLLGIGTNAWSNYINPEAKAGRRITVEKALILKNDLGLTLDWIYAGDRGSLSSDIAKKLREFERSGEVVLQPRLRGRRAKPLKARVA